MKDSGTKSLGVSNVLCINCGGEIKGTWNYCPNCRDQIATLKCPHCNNDISSAWKFCPHCQEQVNEDHLNQVVFHDANEWLRAVLRVSK